MELIMTMYLATPVFVIIVSSLLSGCAAMYGETEVTPTQVRSVGGLEKASIKTLAIGPVMIPDREGDLGDVERLTLDAYDQIIRAVETKGTTQFKVLTPLQFQVALDPRMTDKEQEAALLDTARRTGASHIFVLGSKRVEGGEMGFAHAIGLQKRQAIIPVSVKVLGTSAGRTLWREDFDTAIKFSAVSAGTVKTEARKRIVETGVERFISSL
jgi:hypothetical protein